MIDLFLNNFVTIISLTLGLISIVYTWHIRKKDKTKKRISLDDGKSYSVFEYVPTLDTGELELRWNGEAIGNLFVTDMFIKNSGNIALTKKDFMKDLEFSFEKKVEILRVKLFSSSNFTELKWQSKKKSIKLDINRLEKDTYIFVEAIYTAEKTSSLEVDVKIQDGTKDTFKRNFYTSRENKKDNSYSYYSDGPLFFMYLSMLCAILYIIFENKFPEIYNKLPGWIYFVVILSIHLLALVLIIQRKRRKAVFFDLNNWTEFDEED